MFTGLIEAVGSVEQLVPEGAGARLGVRAAMAADVVPGESVAINGVCLTMTRASDGIMYADVGPETARVTTLGALRAGQAVNLERAMRADSRLGGHFVQGHVDGIGRLREVRAEGDAHMLSIGFPPGLAAFFVVKGSVAVDGISLTVAQLGDGAFEVMIIPYTWAHTNLASLAPGSAVNLECDMIGKYVARAVGLYR
jgi:riboflavin synthase